MSPLTRRRLLGSGLIASAGFLLACSGGAEKPPGANTAGTAGTPNDPKAHSAVRDKLTVGVVATDSGASINATTSASYFAYAATMNVSRSISGIVDGKVVNDLATSITSTDGVNWTIALDPMARFSDGSPVTATDVLASLRTVASTPTMASTWADLDLAASAVIDAHTVRLTTKRIRTDFAESVMALGCWVVKDGDFAKLIGPGPYQLGRHDDKGYQLIPNPHYAGPAAPIAEITVLAIADAAALEKAVQSGQVDLGIGLPGTAARTLRAPASVRSGQLDSAAVMAFGMNCTTAPFNDPAARKALRQLVNRTKLREVVLGGQGVEGADVIGLALPGYDDARTAIAQDTAAAKAVFAAAGITKLTMVTSEFTPGLNDSAELLRQQFAEIGVNLEVTKMDPAAYFQDFSHFKTYHLYTMFYANRLFSVSLPMFYGKDSPMNFGGFDDPEINDVIAKVTTEPDAPERAKLNSRAQQILYTRGPDVIWGYRPSVDGVNGQVPEFSSAQGIPMFGMPRPSR